MRVLAVLALCAAVSGCAARRLELPADPGTPLPGFAQVHRDVSRACRGVRTLRGELALAGRAGPERLRGRVIVGFELPASMRLEGVAPFGSPVFILASRRDPGGVDHAALLLPREARVLQAERPGDVLGALTGVSLEPGDVLAILTGCVVVAPDPQAGRQHGGGWASIDLTGGATLFLRKQAGVWRVRAASRRGWQIEYDAWQGDFPRVVGLRSRDAATVVDLTATMAQLEANVDIDPAAFAVTVPVDATPITLDELRAAGPLRDERP